MVVVIYASAESSVAGFHVNFSLFLALLHPAAHALLPPPPLSQSDYTGVKTLGSVGKCHFPAPPVCPLATQA